jgi:hypothetical protein
MGRTARSSKSWAASSPRNPHPRRAERIRDEGPPADGPKPLPLSLGPPLPPAARHAQGGLLMPVEGTLDALVRGVRGLRAQGWVVSARTNGRRDEGGDCLCHRPLCSRRYRGEDQAENVSTMPRRSRSVDPPDLAGGPRPRVAAVISVWPGTVRAQGDGLVGIWALQARGHRSCSRSIGHTGMCASAGQVARLASVGVRARRPRARRRNQGVTGEAAAGD